jgi:hypothetical protein
MVLNMKKLVRIFLCLSLSLCVFSNYTLAGYSSSDDDDETVDKPNQTNEDLEDPFNTPEETTCGTNEDLEDPFNTPEETDIFGDPVNLFNTPEETTLAEPTSEETSVLGTADDEALNATEINDISKSTKTRSLDLQKEEISAKPNITDTKADNDTNSKNFPPIYYDYITEEDHVFINQFSGSLEPARECRIHCDKYPLSPKCCSYSNKVYRLPNLCEVINTMQTQDENSQDLKELKSRGLNFNHDEYLANYNNRTIFISRQFDENFILQKDKLSWEYCVPLIAGVHTLIVLRDRWIHGWGMDKGYWNNPVFWEMVDDKNFGEDCRMKGKDYFPKFLTRDEALLNEIKKTRALLEELNAEFGKEEWFINR